MPNRNKTAAAQHELILEVDLSQAILVIAQFVEDDICAVAKHRLKVVDHRINARYQRVIELIPILSDAILCIRYVVTMVETPVMSNHTMQIVDQWLTTLLLNVRGHVEA